MTTDPKVVQLVVNKDAAAAKEVEMVGIDVTIGAQIKYCDDEVTLVKVQCDVAGQVNFFNHITVQTPKK